MKYIKTFTFWFIVMSMVSNCLNAIGVDEKNILIVAFNPILSSLDGRASLRGLLFHRGVYDVTYILYLANTLTSAFYGILLDAFRIHVKRTTFKANGKE